VFGLLTPSILVQNSEELITRRNLCGLYNSWPCWELNCDRLALPECMAWSQLRAVALLFLGYPLNRKLGGSRAFLDVLERRQIFWACYNSNPGSSVLYPSHVSFYISKSWSYRIEIVKIIAVTGVEFCWYIRPPHFHLRNVPVSCQAARRLLDRKATFAACNQYLSSVPTFLGFREAT
jgi:hypothetical protein